MLNAAEGAETIVFLATSPDVEGKSGGYYEKKRRVDTAPLAGDRALAERFWRESEKLVAN